MVQKDSSIRQNPASTSLSSGRWFADPMVGLRVLLALNLIVALMAFFIVSDLVHWVALLVPIASLIAGWRLVMKQTQSPALAEARLMALTARIRPHFLFNSLNGILGIIRNDPRRAEKALEELADLFRALMQDPRELVPLSAEIALCRQYIELERLRLGERVRINWDIEQCPPDALMPPLMLQPLVENAVYHGIEPASDPGAIDIRLLHNQMALANIRERLTLFYNDTANLDAEVRDGRYIVRIVLPYQRRRT